jgi:hypothetical protein
LFPGSLFLIQYFLFNFPHETCPLIFNFPHETCPLITYPTTPPPLSSRLFLSSRISPTISPFSPVPPASPTFFPTEHSHTSRPSRQSPRSSSRFSHRAPSSRPIIRTHRSPMFPIHAPFIRIMVVRGGGGVRSGAPTHWRIRSKGVRGYASLISRTSMPCISKQSTQQHAAHRKHAVTPTKAKP